MTIAAACSNSSPRHLTTLPPAPPPPAPRLRKRSILFDEEFVLREGYKSLRPKPWEARPGSGGAKGVNEGEGVEVGREKKVNKKGKEKARDMFDRMRESPVRRCCITQAKLPRDFLVSLNPITQGPPRGSSQYALCHLPTIQSLSSKKVLGPARLRIPSWDTSYPSVLQQTLQARALEELRLLMARVRSLSGGRSEGWGGLGVVKGEEEIAGGIVAVLDTRGLVQTGDSVETPREMSKLRILRSSSGGHIPIYRMAELLSRSLHPPAIYYLTTLLHSTHPESPLPPLLSLPAHPSLIDTIPLSIALYRLILFSGQRWKGEAGEAMDEGEEVVEGFVEVMEGKMKGVWGLSGGWEKGSI